MKGLEPFLCLDWKWCEISTRMSRKRLHLSGISDVCCRWLWRAKEMNAIKYLSPMVFATEWWKLTSPPGCQSFRRRLETVPCKHVGTDRHSGITLPRERLEQRTMRLFPPFVPLFGATLTSILQSRQRFCFQFEIGKFRQSVETFGVNESLCYSHCTLHYCLSRSNWKKS